MIKGFSPVILKDPGYCKHLDWDCVKLACANSKVYIDVLSLFLQVQTDSLRVLYGIKSLLCSLAIVGL